MNLSECFSTDLTAILSEDCQNKQANFNHNGTIFGGCQQNIDVFSQPILKNELMDTELEKELDQYYTRSYNRDRKVVYSDSPYDPDYEEKPVVPMNKIARRQKDFYTDYLDNTIELSQKTFHPTRSDWSKTFTDTRHKKIFRTPRKGKDGNTYHFQKGGTPKFKNGVLTPRRSGNINGTKRVFVNPATDKIESTEMHHVGRYGRDGHVVELSRVFHEENNFVLHDNPSLNFAEDGVIRSDFASELREVRKTLF